MLSINITKLRSEVEDRENKKIKIFEKILDMCYQKILNTNKQNNDYSCTFVVPNVVFGLPLYNIEDCIIFIMDKLVEKGFEIYFALPTTIHIYWRPKNYLNKNNKDYTYVNNTTHNKLEYYNSLQPQNQMIIKYNDIHDNNNLNNNIHNNNNNNIHNNNHNNNIHNHNNNNISKHNKNNTTTITNNNIHYKPIDTYKESSNFIYDLDNLDIFQNKVDHLF